MVRVKYTLADLQAGNTGTVRDIEQSNSLTNRLMDLGFLPGTKVKALCCAPLGDPLTFFIRGYCIGLRKSEARLITLDREDPTA
ncbi:ferrous iron transport protein A [bacterium]|nr:ferrous iron transport protein A [bacterium]